jgi:hypothetical protein
MKVFAYLDPGSGSMLLQMLLGGLAGVVVAIKMFGKRIWGALAFWKRDEPPAPGHSPPPESKKEAA